MDFALDEEQQMVRDTARELFAKECSLDFVRRAWDDPGLGVALFERHLADWLELAEAGAVERLLFLEEHGRAVAPGPFFASLLAAGVARAAGIRLPGPATVAVAGEDGLWRPHDGAQKHAVPSAEEVEQILVVGGSPDAPRLAVVSAGELPVREVGQWDGLRRLYRVDAGGVAPDLALSPEAWRDAWESALLASASELVGVGRGLLDAAVAYAKERVQFDRPIGSFQGLQWMLVDAALDLERAEAAVAYAAMAFDAGDPDRHRAVAGAKAEAGLAARHCAKTGTQVHGGIGYTWEQGLHLWFRRAHAGDAFLGPAAHHHDRLAALLFDD